MSDRKRTIAEKLIAQWPAFVAIIFIGIGLISFVGDTSMMTGRGKIVFIGIGIAALGYWALANRNDDYNF